MSSTDSTLQIPIQGCDFIALFFIWLINVKSWQIRPSQRRTWNKHIDRHFEKRVVKEWLLRSHPCESLEPERIMCTCTDSIPSCIFTTSTWFTAEKKTSIYKYQCGDRYIVNTWNQITQWWRKRFQKWHTFLALVITSLLAMSHSQSVSKIKPWVESAK